MDAFFYPTFVHNHVYIYLLIGVGVSTNIHWLSDVVADILIGHAIGKIVENDFRSLLHHIAEK